MTISLPTRTYSLRSRIVTLITLLVLGALVVAGVWRTYTVSRPATEPTSKAVVLAVPPSVEEMVRIPAHVDGDGRAIPIATMGQHVISPPSVEDMIRMPPHRTMGVPSVEDLIRMPAHVDGAGREMK